MWPALSVHQDAVVVCGAGAAGMAAALASARAGAAVYLVEAASQPGGTVSHSLIHTLAGLFDSGGALLNNGLPAELVQRLQRASTSTARRRLGRLYVLNASPEVYQEVAANWLESEPRIQLCCRTNVVQLRHSAGRIKEVQLCGPNGTHWVPTRALIDCTGTAEVLRLLDNNLVGSDPEAAAGGLMLRLRGVVPGALEFPRGLALLRSIRAAASTGALPQRCARAWLDSGVVVDEVYVKLFVPLPADWREQERHGEITRAAIHDGRALIAFLERIPEFAAARLDCTGQLGIRDGGRVRGVYCLTHSDVRAGRKFPDAACRCCWPIEYWDPQRGVSMEYLAEGTHYEIPLRALRVPDLENFWVAGKCLSADHLAQASARVAGTCWAMGEAVGKAAVEAAR
jgi:hypothetical protein